MPSKSPKVDAYIKKSPEFSQPIMAKVRKLAHQANPDIIESIKWSCPCFEHEGIVLGIGAFKKHVAIRFWRGKQIPDPNNLFGDDGCNNEMGSIKASDVSDLPADKVLVRYIKAACKQNEVQAKQRAAEKKSGVKKTKKKPVRTVTVPDDFAAALQKKKKALATFDGFSYSHRKEYVEWITEAKREETRERRIKQAIEWLAEGKSRHWKYQNC